MTFKEYIKEKDDSIEFSPEELEIANKTSRSLGAVGLKAIVPKYILANAKKSDKILDFGAGKDAQHAINLKLQGFDVTAYEFGANAKEGLHDKNALSGKYSLIYMSNVLNVQSNPNMLKKTLTLVKKALKGGGKVIGNYPESPRKMGMATDEFTELLKQEFKSVERVGGTKKAPILEMR